jgi:hypothetical protein
MFQATIKILLQITHLLFTLLISIVALWFVCWIQWKLINNQWTDSKEPALLIAVQFCLLAVSWLGVTALLIRAK